MTVNATLSTTWDELARAKQGIRRPEIVTLPAGQILFRFASTKNMRTGASIPSNQWARGAWWIEEHNYRKIIDRFSQGRLGLGTVGRSAAAVQPSWSNMDVSIKACLVQEMNVYMGQGSTQYRDQLPNGMVVTLTGWPDIQQIYIPGIRGPAFNNLRIMRQKVISTDNFGL
jgi:hypothetical protein